LSLPVEFRPDAAEEYVAATAWYEAQRAGLGREFVEAIDTAIAGAVASPELYREVHEDVRRVPVKRFPYLVFYRVLEDRLRVIAVLHGHRDPATWRDRT
jgi:toxin ParE1/3/4